MQSKVTLFIEFILSGICNMLATTIPPKYQQSTYRIQRNWYSISHSLWQNIDSKLFAIESRANIDRGNFSCRVYRPTITQRLTLVYMRIIKSRRYSAILVRTRNSSIIEHPGFQNLLKLYIARVALSILYSLQYASPRVQSHVYFINNHGTRIRNIISDFNRGELHINRH